MGAVDEMEEYNKNPLILKVQTREESRNKDHALKPLHPARMTDAFLVMSTHLSQRSPE